MPIIKNPIPVTFSPDTTTQVLFQVPCIVEGIDVKQKLDAIDSALSTSDANGLVTVSSLSSTISNVSSSISASITDLTNTVNALAATIPTPGGPTNAVQYKTGAHSLGGSSNFVFNSTQVSLKVGKNIELGAHDQVIIGKNNTTGNTNSLFAVGNGTDADDRYDAFKIDNFGSKLSQTVHGGGVSYPLRFIDAATTSTYQITLGDYVIVVYHNGGDVVIPSVYLPAAGVTPVGTVYVIKDSAASAFLLAGSFNLFWDLSTQSILGATSLPTIFGKGQSWTIINTGIRSGIEAWEIIANQS